MATPARISSLDHSWSKKSRPPINASISANAAK
jgi:hypothetical protein